MSCNKKIDVSGMRHRIKFQRPVYETDSIGGQTKTYETYYESWASITPVKSFQKWQSDQLSMRVSHKVSCRYFDGLKSDDRILFGLRQFEIQEIINVEERKFVYDLMANEGDAS